MFTDPVSIVQAEEGQAISSKAYDLSYPGFYQPTQELSLAQTAPAKDEKSQKNQACKDKVENVFKVGSTTEQSTKQFKKFVDEVCPSLDLRMPSKLLNYIFLVSSI